MYICNTTQFLKMPLNDEVYKDDSNAWYKADFKGIKVGFKGI